MPLSSDREGIVSGGALGRGPLGLRAARTGAFEGQQSQSSLLLRGPSGRGTLVKGDGLPPHRCRLTATAAQERRRVRTGRCVSAIWTASTIRLAPGLVASETGVRDSWRGGHGREVAEGGNDCTGQTVSRKERVRVYVRAGKCSNARSIMAQIALWR